MTDAVYFFDTYALVEIFKGNEGYAEYSRCRIVTTYLDLFELYYNLIKSYRKEIASEFLEYLKDFCIALDFNWIYDSSELKLLMKKQKLSYADCLGYIIAKKLGIKFLTGDRQFRGMDNVEFVQ